MAEEFQESEVMFDSGENSPLSFPGQYFNSMELRNSKMKIKKKGKKTNKSVPVNIPENFSGNSAWTVQYVETDLFEDDNDYDKEGEMVPPHVMVGRRVDGKVAFSVSTGNGRTLKGRDLCQVRNSILRMTGFLET